MPTAVILGVNHNDPLGPQKTQHHLKILKDNGFETNHICVEWKKELASIVIKQRKGFGAKVRSVFSSISEIEAHEFEKTLAYESDSHIPFYPDAEIIWLDENREVDLSSPVVREYSNDRMKLYISCFEKTELCYANITDISWRVIQRGNQYMPDYRDLEFFEAVGKATNYQTNILCIMGAGHGRIEIKGSFANRLKMRGFVVDSIDLTVQQ